MKPLLTIQEALIWLCICPAGETKSKWTKFAYVAFSFILIAIVVSIICSSTVFFLENVSTDLDAALFAVLEMLAYLATIYTFIAALVIRYKIRDTIQSLTDIYNTGLQKDSFRFLARVNNKCEWMSKMYVKFGVIGTAVLVTSLCLVSVLICWLMQGKLDTKYFAQVYRLSLPWNQQSFTGYVFEVLFTVLAGGVYMIINGTFSMLFISFCFNHQAFYEQFCYSLRKMAEKAQNRHEELCELIRFHNTTKNFLLDSAKVYSPFIMIQLICIMLLLACSIFQLDLQLGDMDIDAAFLAIMFLIGIFQMFFYCYFGKLASQSYEQMASSLYEFNWYEQPVDLQKYFVLMIQNARIPVHYHGFGFVVLDLETFTKFMKSVFTYYMVFKTITDK